MGTCKQFGSVIVSAGRKLGGVLLILTAVSGVAQAGGVLAPEIDPTSMCAAVTLLVGGALLLRAGRELN